MICRDRPPKTRGIFASLLDLTCRSSFRDLQRISHSDEYSLTECTGDPDTDKVREDNDENGDSEMLQNNEPR